MKTQAITMMKEDVLSLGRLVSSSVAELVRLLSKDPTARFSVVEELEERINDQCLKIEEKCLDLLTERNDLSAQEIRMLVGSVVVAAKFERLADHGHRVSKLVSWASEDNIDMPSELLEMAGVVQKNLEEVVLCFLTDDVGKVNHIIQMDSHVNYLHDVLSKKLLSHLGEQEQALAQTQTQFLFCARYLERMGDACTSIAKRTYFIVTGSRLNAES